MNSPLGRTVSRKTTDRATTGCQPVPCPDRAMVFCGAPHTRFQTFDRAVETSPIKAFICEMKPWAIPNIRSTARTVNQGSRCWRGRQVRPRALPAQAATAVRDREAARSGAANTGPRRATSPVDVPQADRRAEGRRAGTARGVLRPRLVGDLKGVRSQRARPWRIFRDERVRPLRLRLLDHGPRELRQVGPHLGQCRHRQRRRGLEGRG